jgi:hypothetical protein
MEVLTVVSLIGSEAAISRLVLPRNKSRPI